MSIKSDKWIRRMAEEHGMIEPFEPNQIKEANGQRIIPTAHPATATTSAAPTIQNLHQYQQHHRRPEKLRPEKLRYSRRRLLHHSAQLLCTGAHSRIFPHPAQRPDRLLR